MRNEVEQKTAPIYWSVNELKIKRSFGANLVKEMMEAKKRN